LELFIAQLINGIVSGGIYALLVVSFNFLLQIKGIFQWSLAHIMVMCMYVIWIVMGLLTGQNAVMGLSLGILAAIVAGVIMSVITEPIFRPMAIRGVYLESLVVAIGIGIILTNVMSKFINRGQPIGLADILTREGATLRVGVISFSVIDLFTLAVSALMVLGLFYLLYKSQFGRAFRAIAQNLGKARLMGIPINYMGVTSFAIAGLVAGISGVLLAMNLGITNAGLADTLALIGLCIVLVAGAGNLIGGLIMSFAMGIIQSMTITYLPGIWSDAFIYGAIVLILVIKPLGLFGAKV
jgi:branched-chain amino acid transport system permease protein